jgi:predicted house-cleaning noncanonical NTP pyrophosphatase (MazG superfamily)
MAGAVLLVEQMLILTRAELVEAKDLLEVVLALQEAFNFVKVMLIVIIK